MKSTTRSIAILIQCALLGPLAAHAGADADTPRMRLTVDAADIERRLLHAVIEMPASPGPFELQYVEWTPGNHSPSGPIQNVVDFYVRDADGNALPWKRDPTRVTRITVDVPENSPTLRVELSYIANQPGVNSRSTDTYGYPGYAGINWNTVVFYPADAIKTELIVEPTLTIPEGWRHAGYLRVWDGDAQTLHLEPATLAELIDSPVILGSNIRTWPLDLGDYAPHFIHAVAPSEDLLELDPRRLRAFEEMIRQTVRVFGEFPYDEYHFLVILSDDAPRFGVEHARGTFIAMPARAFVDAETPRGGPMLVMPHEYIHVWNGLLRAPEGLLAPNYHTPARTELLWVYEGLTSYYDEVIAARCGLLDTERYRSRLASTIQHFRLQTGRRWRSVEDTARAMRHLRAGSESWLELRRRQDYYAEGGLFWLEADAIIRNATDNQRSLDDFCRAFFDVGYRRVGDPATYTRADVVAALTSIHDAQDWDDLIRRRIESPGEDPAGYLPRLLGHTFDTEPTPDDERAGASANLRASIGITADRNGVITGVQIDSPAFEAGLGHAMKILSVNKMSYSSQRLVDAVRDAAESGAIDLLVEHADRIRSFRIEYRDGLRGARLRRDEALPDLIEAVTAPR